MGSSVGVCVPSVAFAAPSVALVAALCGPDTVSPI